MGQWKVWDITKLVQKWYAKLVANDGMLLLKPKNIDKETIAYFWASEATDESLRPRLVIAYEEPQEPTGVKISITKWRELYD